MKYVMVLCCAILSQTLNSQSDTTWIQDGIRYVSDAGIPREYLKSYDSLRAATRRFDYLSDECNLDNQVYLPEREFIFDYYYEKNGVQYKLNTNGRFVAATDTSPMTIRQIGYKIEHGNCLGMTQVKYQYRLKGGVDDLFEASGVIENGLVTWLHPPRSLFFGSLEVLPFPYFNKTAAQSAQPWHWDLLIGNPEYLSFIKPPVETLLNRCTYSLEGQETCRIMGDYLTCSIVDGMAQNEIGGSKLKSWYHETFGFVRWEGVNVDGGSWRFELVAVEGMK